MAGNTNFSIVTTVHFHLQCSFRSKVLVLYDSCFSSVYSELSSSVLVSCMSQQHSVILHIVYRFSDCESNLVHILSTEEMEMEYCSSFESVSTCVAIIGKRTTVSHQWAALLSLALLIELYVLHFFGRLCYHARIGGLVRTKYFQPTLHDFDSTENQPPHLKQEVNEFSISWKSKGHYCRYVGLVPIQQRMQDIFP